MKTEAVYIVKIKNVILFYILHFIYSSSNMFHCSKEHNATLENYNRQQLEGMEKLEQNLKDNENRCIDLQYQ